MSLTSFEFLIFLAALTFFWYALPVKIRWILLPAANLIFYAFAGLPALCFAFSAAVVSYLGAIAIERMKSQRKKQLMLALAVVLILGTLITLKYSGFLLGQLGSFGLILPLGISFYTLQMLGYVLDVWRGVCTACKSIMKALAVLMFFPTISLGPLQRFQTLSEQVQVPRRFDYDNITRAALRILWGFFKKLVLADRLAVIVNSVYNAPDEARGWPIAVATVLFAFQLYADFSSCMDIVIGAAGLLGIRLDENFTSPFIARSISEYWRRWHITLGLWFKDYLYYPLLKSALFQGIHSFFKKRTGKRTAKTITNTLSLLVLWFLIGLWHGPSWGFIIGSGLLHWFLIVFGEIFAPLGERIKKVLRICSNNALWKGFQTLRTFLFVCVGFVFFRSGTASTATNLLSKLFIRFEPILDETAPLWSVFGLDKPDFIVVMVALAVFILVSLLKVKYDVSERIARLLLPLRWTLYLLLLASVLIFGFFGSEYNAIDFIYTQF